MDAEEKSLSLPEMLAIVKRRRRPMLWTIGAIMLGSLLLALLWPATYRSSGTILIEQQEIPVDLVRSTVTSYADQRVQSISQRVMTTQNLLTVMRRYNLYPWRQKRDSRERLMERMRDDVQFKMIGADVIDPRSGVPRKATIAFTVSYDYQSPELAMKVANDLVSLYLNENLTNRSRQAQDTSQFLEQEAQRLGAQVAELEQKLANFKQQNSGALPEYSQLNMQLLDRTQGELRDVQMRIASLDQQRVFLEGQLAQLRPNSMLVSETGERLLSPNDRLKLLRSELASRRALYGSDHPDIIRLTREIQGLEKQGQVADDHAELQRRVLEAQGELASLRQRYSPEHPDVKRLERTLAQMQLALNVAAPELRPSASAASADNPAWIQIRAQLSATNNDISAMRAQDAALRARIGTYERGLALSPQVERAYRELLREFETAQTAYQSVRAKKSEATMAENLETDRKGERFTLIEPPLPPEEPVSPNLPLLLVVGALLAMLGGAVAVAIAEQMDGTLRSRDELAALIGQLPLALIPTIHSSAEQIKKRLHLRTAAFAATGMVLMLLVAIHFLYRPLDTLWFTAARRLGI